jgi:hypothetical protein
VDCAIFRVNAIVYYRCRRDLRFQGERIGGMRHTIWVWGFEGVDLPVLLFTSSASSKRVLEYDSGELGTEGMGCMMWAFVLGA